MVATILGLGTALPDSRVHTETYISHAKKFSCSNGRQERVLEELYRRSGIETRSSVLAGSGYGDAANGMFAAPENGNDRGPGTETRMTCYENEAFPLALSAATAALQDARLAPDQITHLITVSCTGFYAPGFDIELINQIPLRRSVERTHIGFMGCHAAINALRLSRLIVEAEPSAVVLVCAAELCTLHFQYGWSSNKLVSNSLFSDGAGAVICANSDSHSSGEAGIDSVSGWKILQTGSFVVPDTKEAMTWKVGDHGFQMQLSTQIPEIIHESLPDWLANWLSQTDVTLSDITAWAVHPGGPRVLDAVESCLALSQPALESSRAILAECGNMSSPTVLFILDRMRAMALHGLTVVLAFGPGLTIEAALLKSY